MGFGNVSTGSNYIQLKNGKFRIPCEAGAEGAILVKEKYYQEYNHISDIILKGYSFITLVFENKESIALKLNVDVAGVNYDMTLSGMPKKRMMEVAPNIDFSKPFTLGIFGNKLQNGNTANVITISQNNRNLDSYYRKREGKDANGNTIYSYHNGYPVPPAKSDKMGEAVYPITLEDFLHSEWESRVKDQLYKKAEPTEQPF